MLIFDGRKFQLKLLQFRLIRFGLLRQLCIVFLEPCNTLFKGSNSSLPNAAACVASFDVIAVDCFAMLVLQKI